MIGPHPTPRRHASHLAPPPAFQAFRALHHDLYSSYAAAHLPQETAHAVVRAVFRMVALDWDRIVAARNPAAEAWEQLVAGVGSRENPLPVPAELGPPYDVLVLHHLGGHIPGDIAHATGADIATIRSLITATTPPGA